MIVAFSTSSPWTSVAVLSNEGKVLASGKRLAPMRASEACLTLLTEMLPDLFEVSLFVADLGPGSFTGVRVGVTIAKTLAFAKGAKAAGENAFDLISAEQTVAIPSKKGEYFIRRPGLAPERFSQRPDEPMIGFGPWFEGEEIFPEAANCASLLPVEPMEPEALVPLYLIEPSITPPKEPYASVPGRPRA